MADQLERVKRALADRYAIEREAGHGGMATVYLARDLRHQRQVALKVLRPDLAAALGADRFVREIAVAANLQHPHILPLYDSGDVDGFLFYVMPYVDGPSLRQKLIREGELPILEAVRILRDVADALAYAHKQGVVHRDIKPENVMLSGRHALVADFGVARAVDQSAGEKLTETGVALGTPVYMAPEQAAADPHTDHRADLYAFGVTAYEMLTGQPPFAGLTAQAVLAAHWTEAPVPVTQLRATIPPALAQLIMQCLAKKPADRPQAADDLVTILEQVATPSGGVTPTQTVPVPTLLRRRSLAAVGAAGLIVIGLLGWQVMKSGTGAVTASDIRPVTSEPGVEFQPAISPDGKEVAFVVGPRGSHRLVVRSAVDVTGGGEARLTDSMLGNAQLPRWSPDGESVRFLACPSGSTLLDADCAWKEIGRLGGAVRPVAVPRRAWRASWSPDGARVVFFVRDSIFSAPSEESRAVLLAVHPIHSPGGLHSLTWSPDGRRLAYVSGNSQWLSSGNIMGSSIWIVDAAGGVPVQVTDDQSLNISPAWLDDRHLLFVSNRDGPRGIYFVEMGRRGARGAPQSLPGASDVHSISYSATGRRLTYAKLVLRQNIRSYPIGAPGPIPIGQGRHVTSGNQVVEEHDVSPDGRWIVYDNNLGGDANIYRLALGGGTPVQLTNQPGDELGPRWSPDGSEIAFYGALQEIFVIPAEGGAAVRVTTGRGSGVQPRWSPDGLRIAYVPGGFGPRELRFVARDRVGGPWHEPVALRDSECWLGGWAPDGSGVLCGDQVVSPDGRVLPQPDLLESNRLRPAGYPGTYTRDGRTLYVVAAHEDGRRGIWAIPVGGGAPRLVVSRDDPGLSVFYVSVGPDWLYATVSEYESDVWVMNLR